MAGDDALFEGIERVLVITAHPDDCDFGSAGTIARMTAAGIAVSYCICTDGDAGGFDPSIPRSEMPSLRREEQRAAGAALGVTDITFLGYRDGELQPSIELRHDLARVIRQKRPDRVICQSPERNYDRIGASHPDHLAAGEAALCAIYPDARNPFAYPDLLGDGLEAHIVPSTWIQALAAPDTVVDITDFFDRKIAALKCHVTQLPEPERLEEMIRGWNGQIAQRFSLPEGRLAEAYRAVNTA